MKLKKVIVILFIMLGTISLLGGCGMNSQKVTLTKEQQDNVVKRIIKNYNIQSIEFTDFYKDSKTGTYILNIRINSSSKLETSIPMRSLERFNNDTDSIGLNPIDDFEEIQRVHVLDNPALADVTVIYLEE